MVPRNLSTDVTISVLRVLAGVRTLERLHLEPDPDSMGLGPAGDELETSCPHDAYGEGTCTCTAVFFNVNEPYPQLGHNEKRRLYTDCNTESHWRD